MRVHRREDTRRDQHGVKLLVNQLVNWRWSTGDNPERPRKATRLKVNRTASSKLKCLLAWIGRQDLEGAAVEPPTGPIVDFLRVYSDVQTVLLSDWSETERTTYAKRLEGIAHAPMDVRPVKLADPTDYLGVYRYADGVLSELAKRFHLDEIAVHTSPGTSTMAAVWVLLAKTKYEGVKLFKSWIDKKSGASRTAELQIPFSLSLEILPELAARRAELLEADSQPELPSTNAFDAIVRRSTTMQRLIRDAHKAALFPNPILILGESGTGKELLARAIHAASPRATGPWNAMNCAAIPRELLDSELFGHVRGAFTGAVGERQGRFEACNGGTLFLDEIGDVPPETQVRLLRVLQESEIQRVGESKTRKVDVRIIAATNRDLVAEMQKGLFRDDLFYRLAVLVFRILPLRERREDILPLADHFLSRLNERARDIPTAERKTLSPSARTFAEEYRWPGNVRELENTMARAFALVPGDSLKGDDLRAHVIPTSHPPTQQGELAIMKNFNLNKELEAIERGLIEQAMREAGGVKERAAKLLGLASRQALSHRIRKLGLSI